MVLKCGTVLQVRRLPRFIKSQADAFPCREFFCEPSIHSMCDEINFIFTVTALPFDAYLQFPPMGYSTRNVLSC